jgi:hypothetical protein
MRFYDGYLLLNAAVPVATQTAKPGTPEFRQALRNALENVHNVVGTHGVYNMTAKDHSGLVLCSIRLRLSIMLAAWTSAMTPSCR